jgi:hypothetical protein
MKKVFAFRTEKGANITLEVNAGFETKIEAVSLDGINEEIEKTAWTQEIVSMTVNGNAVRAKFDRVNGKAAASWMMGSQKAAVIIPENIMNDIAKERIENTLSKVAAEKKANKEYNTIIKAMNP